MRERQAVLDRIGSDAAIAALLDTYGDDGDPAVFSPWKPADYEWDEAPAVIIKPPTSVEDASTFRGKTAPETTGQRSIVLLDVVVYGKMPADSTDDTVVEAVAKKIRQLFRGKKFVAPDGLTYQAIASGPIAAPTDSDQMAGYLLQLRLNCGG